MLTFEGPIDPVVATQEGMAASGTLPATDPEGNPITFSVVTSPAKGVLQITNAASGAFTFAPNVGAVGYDTFTFRATDSTGASATGMASTSAMSLPPSLYLSTSGWKRLPSQSSQVLATLFMKPSSV